MHHPSPLASVQGMRDACRIQAAEYRAGAHTLSTIDALMAAEIADVRAATGEFEDAGRALAVRAREYVQVMTEIRADVCGAMNDLACILSGLHADAIGTSLLATMDRADLTAPAAPAVPSNRTQDSATAPESVQPTETPIPTSAAAAAPVNRFAGDPAGADGEVPSGRGPAPVSTDRNNHWQGGIYPPAPAVALVPDAPAPETAHKGNGRKRGAKAK